MRRLVTRASIGAIVAAFAVTGLTLASTANATTGSDSASAGGVRTFVALAPADVFEPHFSPGGPVVGDSVAFHGNLYDATGERQIGVERGVCVFVDLKVSATHCSGTVTLGDSTLEFSGAFFVFPDGTTPRTAKIAVIGGTGQCAGAGGVLHITNLNPTGTNAHQRYVLTGVGAGCGPGYQSGK